MLGFDRDALSTARQGHAAHDPERG
jgi:hypothetical protein